MLQIQGSSLECSSGRKLGHMNGMRPAVSGARPFVSATQKRELSFRGQQTNRHWTNITTYATAEAATETQQSSSKDTDFVQALGILKKAAKDRSVPGALVTEAMVKLSKQNLANDAYAEVIGGGNNGQRWNLVFTADKGNTQKANKGEKASGIYFPIPASQWWRKEAAIIENGIFLGQIAALVFNGPYEYKKNKLSFDFTQLKIRLGPKWFNFDIKSQKKDKAGPFFIFAYADEDIIVAKGRAGGIALWAKSTPTWELKNGIGLY